jgi:sugar transferase (PEP-CTERM/EpsH1 system associated)
MAFDNDKQPDLLFLAHRVPYPLDKGDRIRTFHVLRFLANRASVHLACLADERVTEATRRALAGVCHRLHIIPVNKKMQLVRGLGSLACGCTVTQGAFSSGGLRSIVRQWAQETRFHAAIGSASSMAPYFRLPELHNVPAIIDLMDVDSEKWLDYSRARSWPLSWVFRTEGHRLRRLEMEMANWARAVMLVSQAEVDVFHVFSPWEQVHAVPNGVDLEYFQPSDNVSENRDCVFVGALDYYPNVDAAIWFCQEVWPSIRQQHPTSSFNIVGRRPVAVVQRLAELPGVKLVGEVPDIRPFVASAALVVAPLRIARGLQNKVLEALAMGKAIVASPPALAALKCHPGVDLLSAGTAAEWVKAILHLLANELTRHQLGAAGRKYVEEHHAWNRCLEPLSELLGLTKGSLCPLSS